MIALPPLVGVAAMAGIDRSSCIGETYPWLVRVNLPVLSNELVPTTQYTAPMWISALALVYVWAIWVAVDAHSWPCACETCVRLSPLVVIPPSGQVATPSVLRSAAPHSLPSGIGPTFCGAKIPPVATVSGLKYRSTPEKSWPVNRMLALQVAQPALLSADRPVQAHAAVRLSPEVASGTNP